MSRHPHADLIIAWAEGAEIEFLVNGTWMSTNPPQWDPNTQYRIKPQEKPWYEQIPPHGVLCWVGNSGQQKIVAVITKFYPDNDDFQFGSPVGLNWAFATPLTNDEIKQFLRGEK